jgi:phage terminase large subunit-like protein
MPLSWRKFTKQQKADTEPWMRNKADELAVNNGCWFDPKRAAYMIWWVERHCKLYEGEGFAGKPVIMLSNVDQPDYSDIPEMFPDFTYDDGEIIPEVFDFYQQRIKWHNQLFHSGAFMHWQFECHARIYGWAREAEERWQRVGLRQVRRFRKARVWIPKKSGKTPSLAFNTLYLTCGDGEPGAKSFIAALDGNQAIRVWEHAEQMRQKSPELAANSKTNLNTHKVTFLPNVSHFEPLSSANKNTQNSKEGLNGNVIVDETHVVTRSFMKILEFAGASRPQPLNLAFSTAGNNPEGYGKGEWDLGEEINAGTRQVDNYFHQSYHAPQNLTSAQMKKDPEKYIRMANPALGHTVGMEELKPAFYECAESPSDFATYAMYRLNIWQHSSQVWLGAGVWAGCGGHTFDREENEQRQWVLGLDLARKFDLVACVPTSPNKLGSVDIVNPMFWCNQERIEQLIAFYPEMAKWRDQNLIRIVGDNTTDLRAVKRDIRKFCEKHFVVGIVYDATYAETLIQDLTAGEFGPDGDLMFPALAIGEKPFSQGILTQTGPTADFENELKDKMIRHDGNPVLTWQFGHATVKQDGRGHRQVQKEDRKSCRTVDGVQAAIMSRWGCLDNKDWEIQVLDFYDSNPVEYV